MSTRLPALLESLEKKRKHFGNGNVRGGPTCREQSQAGAASRGDRPLSFNPIIMVIPTGLVVPACYVVLPADTFFLRNFWFGRTGRRGSSIQLHFGDQYITWNFNSISQSSRTTEKIISFGGRCS